MASIHLPQMIYIWPYFMFFSVPLLYPYIMNSVVPLSINFGTTRHQFPRLVILVPAMLVMLVIVHYNTIVHPFTLADNRHYMFYVFRLLLRHPLLKYAAVPIYVLCAWAAITSLGGLPNEQEDVKSSAVLKSGVNDTLGNTDSASSSKLIPSNRVSFVLIWLLATSLSLITAPLVEPRYFIIPWLVWRLQIPIPQSGAVTPQLGSESQVEESSDLAQSALFTKHDHRLWLETAWFLAINVATGYIFLYWGFEWPQESGKVQRFMW